MAITTSADVAPRTNTYAYGAGARSLKKSQRGHSLMPYKKSQAKAVMANTDPKNPKHRHARMHAKAALRGPKPGKRHFRGLMPSRADGGM